MTLAKALASPSSDVIKSALFSILDSIVPEEVRLLDRRAKEAVDQHAFLATFEALDGAVPQSLPAGLEKLTHYHWIRLELMYLIHQKASLNAIMKMKSADEVASPPSFSRLESIHRAIYEGVEQGLPIEASIDLLRQMNLQIVGTEHPTDPLSQEARDTLTKIANAINEEEPCEEIIKALFSTLLSIDAIPRAKRTVVEEVNRNIHITLDKLYDNIPTMVQSILMAYKTNYGEASYALHEQTILEAIEGGIDAHGVLSSPLFRDASWPGFDADGNANVTPAEMRNSIRLYRIRAAEKHMTTIEKTVVHRAKNIERKLRGELVDLGAQLMSNVWALKGQAIQPLNDMLLRYQTGASKYLIDREFLALGSYYNDLAHDLQALSIDAVLEQRLLPIISLQQQKARLLIQLTTFSGGHKIGSTHHQGTLQQFQQLFLVYKEAILDNTDAINLKNDKGERVPASQMIFDKYHALIKDNAVTFEAYPELMLHMRQFGIQLHCFGMTYGVGHIRQDSSIFEKVWNAIFSDLKLNPEFSILPALESLKLKQYIDLTSDERFALHKYLQDGSVESAKILQSIYRKYKNSEYAQRPDNKDFSWVTSELERLELTTLHKDMVENIIISNCENAANILEVESLLSVFRSVAAVTPATIVPLLEKCEDLKHHEAILLDYIKTKIQQTLEEVIDRGNEASQQALKDILNIKARDEIKPLIESKSRTEFAEFVEKNPNLRPYLKKITIEIMVGFSDTERVSGLSALISIQKVQEDFIRLTADFGVSPKLYHGPGGDRNRGGPQLRHQKATLQGNARDILNTPISTQWFRENQFYQAYTLLLNPAKRMQMTHLPKEMKDWLAICVDEGASFYERIHDTREHLGQLTGFMLGQGVHWMVSILNSSSRAAQRGGSERSVDRTASVQTGGVRPEAYVNLDTLRAITATQMKEMLGDSIDLIGPCYGLRQIGMEKALWLYDQCETVRDMVTKETMGVATRNLALIQHALFADHPELVAKNDEELNQWAEDCRLNYSNQLKGMNIKKMSTDPTQQPLLLLMLSRLFAYIAVEFKATEDFLRRFKNTLKRTPTEDKMSVLSNYPQWDAETRDVMTEASLINTLIARLAHHVARGKNLDEVYGGLNDEAIPNSQLTPVGRMLGNIGTASIASLRMQSAYVFKFVDYRENIPRQGFQRVKDEHPSTALLRPKDKPVFNALDEHATMTLIGFFSQHRIKQLEREEVPVSHACLLD